MSGAVDLSALKARAEAPPSAPGAAASAGLTVTEASFQADVVDRSMQSLVILVLHASWDPPSQQLLPTMDRLAAASGGAWTLAKVDIEQSPRIAELFEVKALPTVVAVALGQPVQAFAGPQPEEQVQAWIDSLLAALKDRLPGAGVPTEGAAVAEEPQDPRFLEAEQALETGDLAGAEAAYQRVLDSEPGNAEAAAALAQIRFMARLEIVPADAVAVADANPADVQAQLAAADAELANQQVEAAFTRLVETVRRSTGADKDVPRSRLLSLFELFEPSEPLVVAARRKLASALY
ncbi:tetratricopeptide repeat protein [Rhodococcus sp. X156]|uniref:tetratricopeptide repeat protein n=1 Tax=Rhodococcus sp. X156 TaxID=2499145 RepID=UPI000FD933F5|nr:tetratricopeptide repeat protein [Rhodococcus sp. X156]